MRTWAPKPTSFAVISFLNPVTTASAIIITAMPTATVIVAMRTMTLLRPCRRDEILRAMNSSVSMRGMALCDIAAADMVSVPHATKLH